MNESLAGKISPAKLLDFSQNPTKPNLPYPYGHRKGNERNGFGCVLIYSLVSWMREIAPLKFFIKYTNTFWDKNKTAYSRKSITSE